MNFGVRKNSFLTPKLHYLLPRSLLFVKKVVSNTAMCQARQSTLGYKIDKAALLPIFYNSNLKRMTYTNHQTAKRGWGLI